jgi:hypothetical protein
LATRRQLGGISSEFSSIPVTRRRYSDNEQKNRDAQFAPKNGQKPKPSKEGLRSWELDLPDVAVEGMIDALVYYGRLTQAEAADDDRVAAEIAAVGQRLLEWWAAHWRELDRSSSLEIPPIRVSRPPPETEQ